MMKNVQKNSPIADRPRKGYKAKWIYEARCFLSLNFTMNRLQKQSEFKGEN